MKIPVGWAEEAEYVEDKSAGMRMHDEKRERRPAMKDDRAGKHGVLENRGKSKDHDMMKN